MRKIRLIYLLILLLFSNVACVNRTESRPAENPSIQMISAWGPFVIEKNSENLPNIDHIQVKISPEIEFEIIDKDHDLFLYPEKPLKIGKIYTIDLTAEKTQRRENFFIRIPCLLYIRDPLTHPEIWKKCEDHPAIRLTNTEGKVLDYSISQDGEGIFYSIPNAEGGVDYWRVDRDGIAVEKIIGCGSSICRNLAINARMEMFSYTKFGNNHQLIVENKQGEQLLNIPCEASSLEFSPDGNYLAFFNQNESTIDILNGIDFQIRSYLSGMELKGTWSHDSKGLLFGLQEFWGGFPTTVIYEWQASEGSPIELFRTREAEIEIYTPQYSGDEDWLLAGARNRNSGFTKQIWLMKRDGSHYRKITQDYPFHHSFFHWNSDYSQMAFQRIRLDVTDANPEVLIWDSIDNKIIQIAQNASMPIWLP